MSNIRERMRAEGVEFVFCKNKMIKIEEGPEFDQFVCPVCGFSANFVGGTLHTIVM
jgi:hypothetical protein